VEDGQSSVHWCMFQVQVELLSNKLATYADYLGEKNKLMKSHHSSTTRSRQVEENLFISFLPASALRPSMLHALNQALAVSSYHQIVMNPPIQDRKSGTCTFYAVDYTF